MHEKVPQKDFDKSNRGELQSFIDILIIDQLCQNENSIPYRRPRFKSCYL
jgi:hypothetical protein